MKHIDLHCDTMLKLFYSKEERKLFRNDIHVDIEKLIKGQSMAQFFALFVELEGKYKEGESPYTHCRGMLDRFHKEIDDNKEYIAYAGNYAQMMENYNDNKISAFLTIEEGGVLEGKIERVKEFYDLGVRLITLTWNYENCNGFSSVDFKDMDKGLKEFGVQVVEEMNNLGMIIDTSHLSDAGFYDVARLSTKPFVASHSNSRVITNVERNLTDDMIKILANKGGVCGLNLCIPFLGPGKVGKIDYMVEHVKHIVNVGGIEVMSLGTDFDGIGGELEIPNIGEIGKLSTALNKAGFSDDAIEKIFYKNNERIIKEVL